MALFDKMFGRGASAVAEKPQVQDRFETLKKKYQVVLRSIEQQNIRLQNLHVENDKLFIRGVAPSEDAKNRIWDQVKLVDPQFSDLQMDLSVSAPAARVPAATQKTYTVVKGDTLSKISKQFYGDANEYMRIFYANRDKLTDPDKIQIGQTLIIPDDTDD